MQNNPPNNNSGKGVEAAAVASAPLLSRWKIILLFVMAFLLVPGVVFAVLYLKDGDVGVERPPQLEAGSGQQGLALKGVGFGSGFASFSASDDEFFLKSGVAEKYDKLSLPFQNGNGVHYLHADEDLSFLDIMRRIDPAFDENPELGFVIAYYSSEEDQYMMTQNDFYSSNDADQVRYVPLAGDALSAEIVSAGEVFLLVATEDVEVYGLLSDTDSSTVNYSICSQEAGWHSISFENVDVLKRLVSSCSERMDSVWLQYRKSPVSFRQMELEKLYSSEGYGYNLAWVYLH